MRLTDEEVRSDMTNPVLELSSCWFDGSISLASSQTFTSDCVDTVADHLVDVVGPTLETQDSGDNDVSVVHHYASLGASILNLIRFGGSDYVMRGVLAPNTYIFSVILDGDAETKIDGQWISLHAGHTIVMNPCSTIHARGAQGFQALSIMLDRVSLAKVLSLKLGRRVVDDFRFDSSIIGESRLPAGLHEILQHQATNSRQLPFRRRNLQTELSFEEQLAARVIDAFSYEFCGTTETAPAHPSQLRLAEAFIQRNFTESITLEEVCSAAGVASRALQRAFSVYRGMTWIEYLRSVRLDHARRVLLCGDAGGSTVTDKAFESGFTHLGRFSAEYRERFAETPSMTWRRARRRLSGQETSKSVSRTGGLHANML